MTVAMVLRSLDEFLVTRLPKKEAIVTMPPVMITAAMSNSIRVNPDSLLMFDFIIFFI